MKRATERERERDLFLPQGNRRQEQLVKGHCCVKSCYKSYTTLSPLPFFFFFLSFLLLPFPCCPANLVSFHSRLGQQVSNSSAAAQREESSGGRPGDLGPKCTLFLLQAFTFFFLPQVPKGQMNAPTYNGAAEKRCSRIQES